MKRIIFSLAFMLIGVFAFANTENRLNQADNYSTNIISSENDFSGVCYISLGYYDEDGNRIGGVVLQINDVESFEECEDIADWIQEVLNN